MTTVRLVCALAFAAAAGCASLAIEVPRHVTLKAGEPAEIAGDLQNGRTPVGGVDVVEGGLPPGLAIEHRREENRFFIRGVPSAKGRYEVDIGAWTYGTNFPGDRATATMIIDVVE